ncbi:MAG: DUF2946 domain-containing protein [Burkholderiales bacterium]
MTLGKLRIATCLASFAMLVGALAPAVTHLLGAFAPQGAPWAVLCTSKGLVRLAPPSGSSAPLPSNENGKFAGTHCPFCLPHAGTTALPSAPAVVTAILAAEPDRFLPTLFLCSPRPLHAWATAQPRAPPRFLS